MTMVDPLSALLMTMSDLFIRSASAVLSLQVRLSVLSCLCPQVHNLGPDPVQDMLKTWTVSVVRF